MATGQRPPAVEYGDEIKKLMKTLKNCPKCGLAVCQSCVLKAVIEEVGLEGACCLFQDSFRGKKRTETEFIMEQFVLPDLAKKSRIECPRCSEEATCICIDCIQYYCNTCSILHVSISFTKHHVLQPLPQVQQTVSSRPSASPCPPSTLTNSPMDSVHGVSDPQSCSDPTSQEFAEAQAAWNEFVEKEVRMLQQALKEKQESQDMLQKILSMGQELLDRVNTSDEALEAFMGYLLALDVTEGTDMKNDDTSVKVDKKSMEKHLSDIRKSQHIVSQLDTIQNIRTQLIQLTESLKSGKRN